MFFIIILSYYILFFFFFQAEDGIRDLYVTGVQTCALPIYAILGGVVQDGISPARSLTKLGAGTLVLNGNNTYTGQTNILGGIVNIQNSAALGGNNSQLSATTTANASISNNGAGTLVGPGATLQLQGGLLL